MDKIALIGLEFHGYHGVRAEEASLGARFVVDIEMGLDLSNTGDDLAATVDYADAYRLVKEELEERRYYLIEALANHLADRILAAFAPLVELTVRVHKPHAPLAGVFRDVYAEVRRQR
ncbi:MAG TPA: dihydroneopterin aldolase [Trueperaceae bacterium]